MTKYTYLHAPNAKVIKIKTGFSWTAFLFGPLWALVKSAWNLFMLLAVVFIFLIFIDETFVQKSKNIPLLLCMFAAYLAYMIVCGRKGNEWLLKEFESKGYKRSTNTTEIN
jgi:hypothetical protein